MIQFKRDENQKSNKLHLDKYYTPIEVANYCIEKAFKVIGRDNITEIIEPSAGNGSFSLQIDDCIAYDIEPDHESIIQQDYLALDVPYKKGRMVIGNPPFGTRNSMSLKFFKKSIEIADYIAFIQPISQLNNNQQMYHFNLIKSYDLGMVEFSGNRKIHCCFNIWERPENNILNKPPIKKMKDIEIKEVRKSRNQLLPDDWHYDIGICAWGSSIGQLIENNQEYAKELYIKIHNEIHKDKILDLIINADWENLYPMTSTPNLLQWQIIKYITDNIPDLE